MSPATRDSWRDLLKRTVSGRERVAALSDGDYFGEIALLQHVPRTATVRTLVPTLVLSLRNAHFQELLKRHPHLETRFRERTAALAKASGPAVA